MVATTHDSQGDLKQVISAELDHCKLFIQIGKKKKRLVFGFQGLQFQQHTEPLAVVTVPLGNWLAHKNWSPSVSVMYTESQQKTNLDLACK